MEENKTPFTDLCVLMGFQAWLGKTVVDSDLSPYNYHMLAALLIVAFN
jgi:cytochrome c oxidase assembly protein subunit 15